MNDFFNAAVWEQAWREDRDTSLNKMRKSGVDPTRSFDSKAKLFNEQTFSEEGRKRAKRILNWLEGRGVRLRDASVLDIGAATGGFTVPFAERGAYVTAVESSLPQVELLQENIARFDEGRVKIVPEPFENLDVEALGWSQAFDFVFVSMCPVIADWDSVEKLLRLARRFCYISMPASIGEHSLVQEIWPLLTDKPIVAKHMEMGYLLHLLYLKGYAYESLVTRESKSKEVSREAALQEMTNLLPHFGLTSDERTRNLIADYLERAYPTGKVVIREGGRFGKVLIRLQEESMPAGEEGNPA